RTCLARAPLRLDQRCVRRGRGAAAPVVHVHVRRFERSPDGQRGDARVARRGAHRDDGGAGCHRARESHDRGAAGRRTGTRRFGTDRAPSETRSDRLEPDGGASRRVSRTEDTMGLLTFSINVTLDGCVDHQEGIADDETHAFFTRLMDEGGAMLWGRVTYEMMESYWPAGARGDEEAPPAMREWPIKLEAKPKYVVSSTRKDFQWTNSHHIASDLRTGVQKLKDATPAGVLLGSGKLATELDRLDLIDEYKFLVHPRIAGHGPTLYQSGLPSTRRLELVSAKPLSNGAVAMHYRRARGQQLARDHAHAAA